MKTKIRPALSLIFLAIAASSCAGPSNAPSVEATVAPNTEVAAAPSMTDGGSHNGGPVDPDGGKPPGSSDGQKPPTPETAPAKQTVPTESNAVVLTQDGGIPQYRPDGKPVGIMYVFTNISDKALTVASVEVVNIKGSAFSLASATCRGFVLSPRRKDSCEVGVRAIPQGLDGEGRLVLGIKEDNTVKTLDLPRYPRGPATNAPMETDPFINPPSELAPVNPPPSTLAPSPTDSVPPDSP
jgi:hypothetical protein